MTRRDLLKAPALLQTRRRKPNVLLLMDDQHRADCFGYAGNRVIHTPNFDRLAAASTRFTAAFTSTPTCTPARAALLTGMSPWGHGMLGYSQVARKYPVEMPRLFRDAGYYTTGIGKMHYSPQRNLHGFHQTILDESGRVESPDFKSDYRSWFSEEAPASDPDATRLDWNGYTAAPYALPERLHPTMWTGDTAVHFLRDYDRAEPFFLKVSFARPHSPYDSPKRFWDRYRDAELPPARVAKWADRYRERNDNTVTIWHGQLSAGLIRAARQGYYGNVTFIDEQVGRILEALEQRRMMDDTVILYLSDHGDMLGDHNLWRKSYAYAASARIPMLVRVSGVTPGVSHQPVEIRDVLPTLAAAAGVELPPSVEGRDMTRDNGRQFIDLEHDVCYSPENHWSALADGRTTYVFHAQSGEEQLLDGADNPIDDEAQLRLWRSRLAEHLTPRGDTWVKNGKLVLRPKSQIHSPNYPA